VRTPLLSSSSNALLRVHPATAALGWMLRPALEFGLHLQIGGRIVMEMRIDDPRVHDLSEREVFRQHRRRTERPGAGKKSAAGCAQADGPARVKRARVHGLCDGR
jgi:hypothetical protein